MVRSTVMVRIVLYISNEVVVRRTVTVRCVPCDYGTRRTEMVRRGVLKWYAGTLTVPPKHLFLTVPFTDFAGRRTIFPPDMVRRTDMELHVPPSRRTTMVRRTIIVRVPVQAYRTIHIHTYMHTTYTTHTHTRPHTPHSQLECHSRYQGDHLSYHSQ